MTRLFLIVTLFTLIAGSDVLAQTVYRWVDDQGEVHYGHAVPPEHAARGYERLGPDGVVRERVEPAMTPEQIAERREYMRRERERASAARDQESRDRLLLATYRSNEDLMASLERRLLSINSQRASIRTAIRLVDHRFENLVSRAAEHTRYADEVPDTLESSVAETRTELIRLRRDLAELDHREERTREEFRADLDRFRELTGGDG